MSIFGPHDPSPSLSPYRSPPSPASDPLDDPQQDSPLFLDDDNSSSSSSPAASPNALPSSPPGQSAPLSPKAARAFRHANAQHIALARSLDQLDAGDLSIHLYDAFALKHRLYVHAHTHSEPNEPADSQSSETAESAINNDEGAGESTTKPKRGASSKPKQDLPVHSKYGSKDRWYRPDTHEQWRPRRAWTAWPLPPEEVPRAWEGFGRDVEAVREMRRRVIEGEHGPGSGREDVRWRGSVFEDALEGVFERKIRQRLAARGVGVYVSEEASEQRERDSRGEPRRKRRKVEEEKSGTPSETGADGSDGERGSIGEEKGSGDEEDENEDEDEHEDKDEEQSDAHENEREGPDTEHGELDQTEGESEGNSQRGRTHARQAQDASADTLRAPRRTEQAYMPIVSADTQRTRALLQPCISHMREQVDDLLLALHRARRNATRDTADVEPTAAAQRRAFLTDNRDDPTRFAARAPGQSKRRRARVHQMDWSDVLGHASLIGVDAGAVERAKRRCEMVFGQTMGFRTVHEFGGQVGEGTGLDGRVGAVHNDGFLEVIKAKKGWGGKARLGGRKKGKKARGERDTKRVSGSEDEVDVEMD